MSVVVDIQLNVKEEALKEMKEMDRPLSSYEGVLVIPDNDNREMVWFINGWRDTLYVRVLDVGNNYCHF